MLQETKIQRTIWRERGSHARGAFSKETAGLKQEEDIVTEHYEIWKNETWVTIREKVLNKA